MRTLLLLAMLLAIAPGCGLFDVSPAQSHSPTISERNLKAAKVKARECRLRRWTADMPGETPTAKLIDWLFPVDKQIIRLVKEIDNTPVHDRLLRLRRVCERRIVLAQRAKTLFQRGMSDHDTDLVIKRMAHGNALLRWCQTARDKKNQSDFLLYSRELEINTYLIAKRFDELEARPR